MILDNIQPVISCSSGLVRCLEARYDGLVVVHLFLVVVVVVHLLLVVVILPVIIVVLLSSVLIVTYYKKLHPRLNMFSVYSNASKEMVEDTVHNVGLLLTTTSSNSEEPQTEERTAEYFV